MEMQMELSYVFAVVITGLVVVFLGLILLIAFISLIGMFFKKMAQKNKPAAKTAVPAKPAPTVKIQPAAPVQPDVSSEDDDEIIAVISAAVAMMSASDGKNYRVKSVRAVSDAPVGNAWASAARAEAVRPF